MPKDKKKPEKKKEPSPEEESEEEDVESVSYPACLCNFFALILDLCECIALQSLAHHMCRAACHGPTGASRDRQTILSVCTCRALPSLAQQMLCTARMFWAQVVYARAETPGK
jgi:hypothetical protein